MNDIIITLLILNTQIFILNILINIKELKTLYQGQFKDLQKGYKFIIYILHGLIMYIGAIPILLSTIITKIKKLGGKRKNG